MKNRNAFIALLLTFSLGWIFTSRERDSTQPPQAISLSERKLARASNSSNHIAFSIARKSSFEDQTRHVIALASSLPISEIENWLTHSYLKTLDRDLQELFRSIISERWLEADPAAFITWARKFDESRNGFYLAKWAEREPQAALTFIKNSSPPPVPTQVLLLMKNLTQVSPDSAFSLAEEIFADGLAEHYFSRTVSSLAQIDLSRLLAMRASWSEELRAKSRPAIAGCYLEEDFFRCLDFLEKENADWNDLLSATHHASYLTAKETVLNNAQDLPSGWLKKMIAMNPDFFVSSKSLKWLESSAADLNLSEASYQNILKRMTRTRFDAEVRPQLMNFINGDDFPLETREAFLSTQIMQWDRSDREGLLNWLDQLNDSELNETANSYLEYFNTPMLTSATLRDDPGGLVRSIGISNGSFLPLSQRWDTAETTEAITAFRNLSAEEKQTTFQAITKPNQMTKGSIPFLAEVFHHQNSLPLPSDRILKERQIKKSTEFAVNWALQEPSKAAAWAATLPPGPSREWSLKNVARAWQDYSQIEAQDWINSLPPADKSAVTDFLQTR